MAERTSSATVERVVVSVDRSAPDATFAMAVQLASSFGSELIGVCIEDINLVRCVELPFTRQVSLLSAQPRAVDVAALERQLQVREQHARARFDALVEGLDVPRSFRVLRSALSLTKPVVTGGVVTSVVIDTEREIPSLVEIGVAAARDRGSTLQFLCLAAPEQASTDLRSEVAAELETLRCRLQWKWLSPGGATLSGSITTSGPVVASAVRIRALSERELAELLDRAGGPLIAVT